MNTTAASSHTSRRARSELMFVLGRKPPAALSARGAKGATLAPLCRPHAITDAANVEDEIGTELAAQRVNVHFDRVALDFLAPAVEALFYLRARQDRPGPLHEQPQECELPG